MRLNFAIVFAVLFASLVAPAVPTIASTVPALHESVKRVDVQKEVPKMTDVSSQVRVVPNSNAGNGMSDYEMSGASDKIRLKGSAGSNSLGDYKLNDPMPGIEIPTDPEITIPGTGSNVPDVPPIYPGLLCEYPISVEGDGAIVHPGSSIVLTADQPVDWHTDVGLLEKISSTKARYYPPRYFNGNSGIDVKVAAYKGFCRTEVTVKVRAGPVEKIEMDYPTKVFPNRNTLVNLRVFDKYNNPVQGATVSLTLVPLGSADDTSLSADGMVGKKVTPKADETGSIGVFILAGREKGKYELTARYGLKTVSGVFEVRSASGGGHSDDDDDNEAPVVVTNSTATDEQPGTAAQQSANTTVNASQGTTTTQPTASAQDSSASSLSISYPKKAQVGDVIKVRVTMGNTAVAGRDVTITSPDGKSVRKKTSQVGYVEQVAEMAGRYAFQVDGAEKPVYVDVSEKQAQPAQPQPNEPSFDIVGALTGNSSMLPVVALLVLLGVAVIGVAVYFLRKKEPE